MLSFKYIYRNLIKMGRPGDQVLSEQPQIETLRQVPVPAAGDLAPLTQVRRSLITVYKSGRTGSKSIDHITRAVYKEWRYRALEYPDVKSPLQTACSAIASGVNSTNAADMEAVNRLIAGVHARLVAMGFCAESAYHLIAVLVVIEANPQQVFSTVPVLLPASLGARNPLFPKEKEMKPYRIAIADQVYLCTRFMVSNVDIRTRVQSEWDVFSTNHGNDAVLLNRLLSKNKSEETLESAQRLLESLPATLRPYVLALALGLCGNAETMNLSKMETGTMAGDVGSLAVSVDGLVAGQREKRRTASDSGNLLVKQLARIRSPKLCALKTG